MMDLLFGVMPSKVRKPAIHHVARFVLGKALPSVTQEAEKICNAAAYADVDTAAVHLAEPLLCRLECELVSADSARLATATAQMSEVCRGHLVHVLLGLCVYD
jgi:hypothetical protein